MVRMQRGLVLLSFGREKLEARSSESLRLEKPLLSFGRQLRLPDSALFTWNLISY